MENKRYYMYVSTRAAYDPAKTIFVCAPGADAENVVSAEQFARRSGWQALAEYDGAVLVLPVAANGWKCENTALPGQIFDELRGDVQSRNGKALWGRNGKIWCWETLNYLVGYEDGAVFAGNCVVAEPNRFAAAALIGGAPDDYSAGELPSSHWLVREVSSDYSMQNDEIASSLWLIDVSEAEEQQALTYFTKSGDLDAEAVELTMGKGIWRDGIPTRSYQNRKNSAQRLMLSHGVCSDGVRVDGACGAGACSMELAHIILEEYFEHTIRWKNGPDGTLQLHLGRTGFYTDSRFIHSSVILNGLEYAYSVHLPNGCAPEDVRGLPLVFSVHGRGEPAWLFAEKNGWDVLADETKAFVLVSPDSPGNIWTFARDGKAFAAMIDKICTDYQLDRTRVYLTGFSNGGVITREVGTAYPWLFAAIAPYNAPVHIPDLAMEDAISPQLLPSGYELPYLVYVGDHDPAASVDVDEQLEVMLEANHCRKDCGECREPTGAAAGHMTQDITADRDLTPENPAQNYTTRFEPDEVRTGENYYTAEKGYQEGERFHTLIYRDAERIARVGYTVMKNMPHGAICEQSLATWEFLRHFRRPAGSRRVEYMP